jgi:hypothetical protein
VVYACRLSAIDEERVLLNSPIAESVQAKYPTLFTVVEKEVIIKHEGKVTAFEILPTQAEFQPSKPEWISSK